VPEGDFDYEHRAVEPGVFQQFGWDRDGGALMGEVLPSSKPQTCTNSLASPSPVK
jgi:hypothetical protein